MKRYILPDTSEFTVTPLEKLFYKDSYGYRPNKSAIEAIGQARKRCWQYDYVIELDIKGLFDNIDRCLFERYKSFNDMTSYLAYSIVFKRWN